MIVNWTNISNLDNQCETDVRYFIHIRCTWAWTPSWDACKLECTKYTDNVFLYIFALYIVVTKVKPQFCSRICVISVINYKNFVIIYNTLYNLLFYNCLIIWFYINNFELYIYTHTYNSFWKIKVIYINNSFSTYYRLKEYTYCMCRLAVLQ